MIPAIFKTGLRNLDLCYHEKASEKSTGDSRKPGFYCRLAAAGKTGAAFLEKGKADVR